MVVKLPQTSHLKALMSVIRDRHCSRADFIFHSDRIIRLLIEEALNHLPFIERVIQTPLGEEYRGLEPVGNICGVSIMRAGESMEKALRECCRSVRIGKILIQRDELTFMPKLFYCKLPPDVAQRYCLFFSSRSPPRPNAGHRRLGSQGHPVSL